MDDDLDSDSDAGFTPSTPDLFESSLCHELYLGCQARQSEMSDWCRRIRTCQHVSFCHIMLSDRDEKGAREIGTVIRGAQDLIADLNPTVPERWNRGYWDAIERALAVGEFDWSRGWRTSYWTLCHALIVQDAVIYWGLRVVRECPDSDFFYASTDRTFLWFRSVFGLFKWGRTRES